ncbi:hypothetical protein [Teredinibacter franksiae]|uniref:hypothetical protein n=1 Tax=Teredinibacter franksiae TaxID=2761453 RepID=UPI001627419A|nr:hypothetical protein [Teredinibacter franksiae]
MIKPNLHRTRFTLGRLLSTVATALLLAAFCANALSQHVYYRYINEDGVKVLDHSIPPEYAQTGYEVLNASGQVVKVVPPAPSADEIARNAIEREIQERYARLKRRYSSTDDIESAKQRRLRNISTNISILNGNINTLSAQIEGITSKAADFERRGEKVPKKILDDLAAVRVELTIAEELLQIRNTEHQEVISKFDQDILAFAKGEAMEKISAAKIQ